MTGESSNTDHEGNAPLSAEFLYHYYTDVLGGYGDSSVDFDPLTGNYVLPERPAVNQRLVDEARFNQGPEDA